MRDFYHHPFPLSLASALRSKARVGRSKTFPKGAAAAELIAKEEELSEEEDGEDTKCLSQAAELLQDNTAAFLLNDVLVKKILDLSSVSICYFLADIFMLFFHAR